MTKSVRSGRVYALIAGAVILSMTGFKNARAQDFGEDPSDPGTALEDVIVQAIEDKCECPEDTDGLDDMNKCIDTQQKKAISAFKLGAKYLKINRTEMKSNIGEALQSYYDDCESYLTDPDFSDPSEEDPGFDPGQDPGFDPGTGLPF